MVYNTYIPLGAICINSFTILLICFKKLFRTDSGKSLLACLFFYTLSDVFNMLAKMGLNRSIVLSVSAIAVFETLYMVFSDFGVVLLTTYFKSAMALKSPQKWYFWLFLAPFLFNVVFSIVNLYYPMVFKVTDDLKLIEMPGTFFFYAVSIFYMAIDCYIIFKYHYGIDKKRIRLLLFFAVVLIAGDTFNLFHTEMMSESVFQSLILLVFFYTITCRDILLDANTGLYNRDTFYTFCSRAFQAKANLGIFILKITNESFYSKSIDYKKMKGLMKEIGNKLSKVNANSNVYYLKSGQFAVISFNTSKDNRDSQIQTIRDLVANDFEYEKTSFRFLSQIFYINYPGDISSIEELHAIIEKNFPGGDESVTIIKGVQLKAAQREIEVQQAIFRGLANNSYQVYYQPIYDIKAKCFHSAEALIRLTDEKLGPISPEEFIKIAEKNWSICEIGQIVFDKCCAFLKDSPARKEGLKYLEVNLSKVQCMQSSLPNNLRASIDKYSIEPSLINLEVTESAGSLAPIAFKHILTSLEQIGFHFSLDDYGTGFSNNSYMKTTNFNIIKLDKSLLLSITKYPIAKNSLANTIKMLKAMNYKVLMEGVETKEQCELIESLGFDYIQGFYFSKPLNESDFIKFISEKNREGGVKNV